MNKLYYFSLLSIFLSTSYSYSLTDSNGVLLYDWNEPVTNHIYQDNKNYNKLKSTDWGIGNKSDDIRFGHVYPYTYSDPGFSGPNGELYGIELEFSSTLVPPRSANSKTVRHYVDCGQTFFQTEGIDRSEFHIYSTLKDLNISEGSTLWLGWSDYYTHLDKDRLTTVLQFRNQPQYKNLKTFFPNQSDVDKVTKGGPAVSIMLKPMLNDLKYVIEVRDGYPYNWTVQKNNKYIFDTPVYTNQWYDFIIQIKYARDNSGYIRIWSSLSNQSDSLLVSNPNWSYSGPTMYKYPTINGIKINPSPALRWGLYRYNCKLHNIDKSCIKINDNNRYMAKHLGPIRFWKGTSNIGFNLVKPRY